MRFLNKSTIAVVFGVVFANTANAAAFNVTSDQDNITIIGTQGAGYDLDLMANKVITNQNDITGLKTENTDQWNAISAADNLAGSAKTDAQTANTNALAADAKATTANTIATSAKAAADHAEITATNANNKADANTQALASKVDKSIFNADQDRQDHALQDASDKATQAFNTGAYAQSLAVDAQTVAAANKAAVAKVQSRQQTQEATIQNQSAQLANHESRITALESQNNAKFSSLENQQNEDRKEYRAGIAGAASLAGLHYVDTDNAVAVGAANFKDAQGYAIGYRHKFAENVAATLSTSGTSNGDEIVAASASYGW
ncbi:YadA C-terminal domain-containing protein [Enterobacter quasiroggenkampii]|uniref:YadA C-terminal domain-containing protein n=1 Tax=Enterobacter quasiroggenkampii TaxID=2497436 RepID=UPI0021CE5814|nr:YadA C-terminal domain-containing protein [Enterobacter quasiroggenkampii]MCU6399401.1 YadA C-terminal domain-containing protein [Enterobacter quasiroggenkampii]